MNLVQLKSSGAELEDSVSSAIEGDLPARSGGICPGLCVGEIY